MFNTKTATQGMKQRIWQMKLMTAKRILKNEDSFVCNIYKEEPDMGWPGLAAEVKDIWEVLS